MPRLSVVIPTYKEGQSIGPLLDQLQAVLRDVDHEVLVVDDDSRDGTAEAAEARGARAIVRTEERGLATAVVRGIAEAEGTYVCVMDADGQHPPEVVRRMLAKAEAHDADLVVGSRYAEGGSEGGFGLGRRLVSKGAALAARAALPPVRIHGITDPMTGLFLVRRDRVDVDALRPQGYKILLEVIGRSRIESVYEVGYTFGSRIAGESKLGGAVVVQYLLHLMALGWAHPENRRIARFGLVGLTGVLVNLGLLWLLHEQFGVHDLIALPFAIEASILSNFFLNDAFTFRDRRNGGRLSRLARFNTVSLVALIVNWSTYTLLTRGLGMYYLAAEAIAIVVAFAANYSGNMNWTYGGASRFRLRATARHWLPWLPFALLVGGAGFLYLGALDHPDEIYFDEHFYVSVGHQLNDGIWWDPCWTNEERPLNYEHPPLAKFLIAGSIYLFDDPALGFEGCRKDDNPQYPEFTKGLREHGNPYAWRLPSALLGTAAVAFTGLAAGRLFGTRDGDLFVPSPAAAAFGSAFVVLDTLVLSSSRLAILDVFAAGFTMMAVHHAMQPTRAGVWKAALFLGLGFASKYTVVFAGPGVLLLVLWAQFRSGRLTRRRFDLSVLAVPLVPLGVWLATNLPFLYLWSESGGVPYAVDRFLEVTGQAIKWGTVGNASHGYESTAAQWLFVERPVWYYAAWNVGEGTHRFIFAVLNPLLWWSGILAAVGSLVAVPIAAWRRARRLGVGWWDGFKRLPDTVQALVPVSVLPLVTYGAFFFIDRATFLFYATLLVPLFALPLAGVAVLAWRAGPAWRTVAVTGVLLIAGAFVYFMPFATGMEVTMQDFKRVLVDTIPVPEWTDGGLEWGKTDPCPTDPTGAFTEACPVEER